MTHIKYDSQSLESSNDLGGDRGDPGDADDEADGGEDVAIDWWFVRGRCGKEQGNEQDEGDQEADEERFEEPHGCDVEWRLEVNGDNDEEWRKEELDDEEPAVPKLRCRSWLGQRSLSLWFREQWRLRNGMVEVRMWSCRCRASAAVVVMALCTHGYRSGIAQTCRTAVFESIIPAFESSRVETIVSVGSFILILATLDNGKSDSQQKNTGCSHDAKCLLPIILLMPVIYCWQQRRYDHPWRWKNTGPPLIQ